MGVGLVSGGRVFWLNHADERAFLIGVRTLLSNLSQSSVNGFTEPSIKSAYGVQISATHLELWVQCKRFLNFTKKWQLLLLKKSSKCTLKLYNY